MKTDIQRHIQSEILLSDIFSTKRQIIFIIKSSLEKNNIKSVIEYCLTLNRFHTFFWCFTS